VRIWCIQMNERQRRRGCLVAFPSFLAEKLRSSVSKQPQFMMMREGCRHPIPHCLVVVIPALPFGKGMTW
jgi:hypothetical protein